MSSPGMQQPHGDDGIGKLLAALTPEALVQLRITLGKEDPSVDRDSALLRVVEDVLVERLADLERELKELRAAKAAMNSDSEVTNPREAVPTKLSVQDVTQEVTAALGESLPDYNRRIREHVAQAKRGVIDLTSAIDGVFSDVELEASLRAYFALFGLPFRLSSELEAKYARLSEREQTLLDNVWANLMSNAIWGVGTVVIAWAAMS